MITSTLHHLKSFPKFASANLDIIKAYILNQRLVTLGPDLFPFRDDVFFFGIFAIFPAGFRRSLSPRKAGGFLQLQLDVIGCVPKQQKTSTTPYC